jgi:hypothetical protein
VNHRSSKFLIFLLIFSFSFLIYLYGLAPDVLWGDSGSFQTRAYLTEFKFENLVGSHPLYIFITKLFTLLPFNPVAFKVNLASAFLGALGIVTIFFFIRNLTSNSWAALIGSVSLLFSHTFWRHSEIAEVYTLFCFLLVLSLLTLWRYFYYQEKKYLYLTYYLIGLNLSTHNLAFLIITSVLIFLFIYRKNTHLGMNDIIVSFALLILGFSLYGYLISKDLITNHNLWLTLRSALWGGISKDTILNFGSKAELLKFVLFIGLNFPTPNIFLAGIGLFSLFGKSGERLGWLLIVLLGLNLIIVLPFDFPDKYVFYFPTYVIVAFLMGIGSYKVLHKWKVSFYLLVPFALFPVIFYSYGPGLLKKYDLVFFPRDIPCRDNYTYFLTPWQRGYSGSREYGVKAFKALEENSILIADWTPYWVFKYLQKVEESRTDIVLISAGELDSADLNSRRKIYLADDEKGYYPDWIFEKYITKRKGVLFELEKK